MSDDVGRAHQGAREVLDCGDGFRWDGKLGPSRRVLVDIEIERDRQINRERWTLAHDDTHTRGEMALAAACYAAPRRIFVAEELAGRAYETFTAYRDAWPWDDKWWKPKDRRRDLIRAATLIVAEIERIDRVAKRAPDGAQPIPTEGE